MYSVSFLNEIVHVWNLRNGISSERNSKHKILLDQVCTFQDGRNLEVKEVKRPTKAEIAFGGSGGR